MNLPLYSLHAIGSGGVSPFFRISLITPATTFRIPRSAVSGLPASQLKLGNSTHNPTYSRSSSDQVTRYV